MPVTKDPCDICEAVIHAEQAYNREHNICPGKNAVADRLLRRRAEMQGAYVELYQKLGANPVGLKVFFDLLLATADHWNPEQNAEARAARERLEAVNDEIWKAAGVLARLLRERDHLHNRSGFHSTTFYHPLDLIEESAAQNYLHTSYVKEQLVRLRGRYDLKYWPSIEDCISALARDAREAKVEASDPFTDAATRGVRNSRADFLRALFVAIEENSDKVHGFLPKSPSRISSATAEAA